jgi:hypothetical protein
MFAAVAEVATRFGVCRPGMHAAIAEVTTRFGTEVTVAFFPDKSRKDKQRKMYERNFMKDFMPVISEEKNEHVYRCERSPGLVSMIPLWKHYPLTLSGA